MGQRRVRALAKALAGAEATLKAQQSVAVPEVARPLPSTEKNKIEHQFDHHGPGALR